MCLCVWPGPTVSFVIALCLIEQTCVSKAVGGIPVSGRSQHDKEKLRFHDPSSRGEAINHLLLGWKSHHK